MIGEFVEYPGWIPPRTSACLENKTTSVPSNDRNNRQTKKSVSYHCIVFADDERNKESVSIPDSSCCVVRNTIGSWSLVLREDAWRIAEFKTKILTWSYLWQQLWIMSQSKDKQARYLYHRFQDHWIIDGLEVSTADNSQNDQRPGLDSEENCRG